MIDFLFLQLYIRKKYNQNPESYFKVAKQTISGWRTTNKIPKSRLDYFIKKEGTSSMRKLLSEAYKN